MKLVIWFRNYSEQEGQLGGHCSHLCVVSLGNKTGNESNKNIRKKEKKEVLES